MGFSPATETTAVDIRRTGKLVEAALEQSLKAKPYLTKPVPCRAD